MREIASRQDAVFLGRGASWVLRDHPGLLRVFLHATEEWRAHRIFESYHLADVDAARHLVKRSDQQRARFLQSLLSVPWTSPGSYDLCINTTTMDLDETVEMLARLVERRRRAPGSGSGL
jgi:cytidylate kinase